MQKTVFDRLSNSEDMSDYVTEFKNITCYLQNYLVVNCHISWTNLELLNLDLYSDTPSNPHLIEITKLCYIIWYSVEKCCQTGSRLKCERVSLNKNIDI